ncbi:MAG: hypothetical protein A3C93_05950 [Candidatus Lloydbacteria bacterium RIFCSPHIGHO2_02_FULL_54_17]|uniref:Uncharacterized protein n=1 Tax=Candidatus Lloydbacteria bacterium RIFCSPHIGHO2_02_FULL_54_17 TaxID=1798664 RepID=A0A1G2DE87_9BACT|nr:MAG: hypothetical protein A3C93_05950 [Candidatus Lloydbacteria bacterium RIFCSPHIGHO2_02_FULL_54_17]OGZ14208.1 MAG: hypothetical protein A2948_02640 [Candidatus Lloydbacteria bacterium RIFCSPLOWO2_01_FULL_54_18]
MKVRTQIFKQKNGGWSTLELLIALGIMTVVLVPATQVVLGNTEFARDTRFSQAALVMAEHNIENAGRELHADWDSATTEYDSTSEVLPDEKSETMTITDISECLKEVTSQLDWNNSPIRSQATGITTLVTNPSEVRRLGGGCNTMPPSGDWDTPEVLGYTSPSVIDGEATGIDVMNFAGQRYAFLTSVHSSPAKDDFWVIDGTDPESTPPPVVGQIHVSPGLNAIDVARLEIGGVSKTYAFAANDDNADHLMVIDITDPLTATHLVSASRSLPEMTTGVARSIFYYDEKVYIGTQYLGCPLCPSTQNNEFHIFDVSDPTSPVWEGSIDVDRNVNAIVVSDGVAYLATGPGSSSPYTPLKIFDVDPDSLTYLQEIGSFAVPSDEQGTSLYLLGTKLYLGRERATASNKDFYILDVTNPVAPQEFPGGSSVKLALTGATAVVKDIEVQGRYAFLAIENTTSQDTFQVWDVATTNDLRRLNVCTAGDPLPQDMNGLVFVDNLIFASFRSNAAFRILYDTPDVCIP